MRHKYLAATGGLACAFLLSPLALGGGHDDDDSDSDDEIPFDVAEVFFELNNTDGDLGIHALVDGDPWKRLTIEDAREKKLLSIFARGRARLQGLTELFFESAEPPFDELAPEDFFLRFPEGMYEVEGRTIEGEERESEVEVTHAMPAPPEPLVNGEPEPDDPECDPDEAGYNARAVTAPVTISWPAVTETHPDIGDPQGSTDISIFNYEVVVETEIEVAGEEFTTKISAVVPPGVTSMTVPAEFLAQSDEFKFEVLVREESWNQTATESCFQL